VNTPKHVMWPKDFVWKDDPMDDSFTVDVIRFTRDRAGKFSMGRLVDSYRTWRSDDPRCQVMMALMEAVASLFVERVTAESPEEGGAGVSGSD